MHKEVGGCKRQRFI